MKKHIILSLVVFSALSAFAQRYLTQTFTDVTIDSNIVYGQNYEYYSNFNQLKDLKMDVYRPAGDGATDRPVIVLMHAGSFLPESVTGYAWGNKNQNCIVELCKRYARMGYVTVSLSYRIGWNAGGDQETRSKTIIEAVYRAMQDAKTCVRYFKNDFISNGNSWGIDTGKIVLGGTNSGAYVAMAAGTLNRVVELELPKFLDQNLNPFINQTILGDFDGFGGTQNFGNYPGISSRFRGIISLGGASADLSIIESGEPPVIAFHGVNEVTTPYNTDIVITSTGQSVVEVNGAGDYMPEIVAKGNNAPFIGAGFAPGPPNRNGSGQVTTSVEGLYPFYNQGFEPWSWYNGQNPAINPSATMSKAMAYIDTIVAYSSPRLFRLLIDPAYTSVEELSDATGITLYPNPVKQTLFIRSLSEVQVEQIALYNVLGAKVFETAVSGSAVNLADLIPGVYLVSLKLADGRQFSSRIQVQ